MLKLKEKFLIFLTLCIIILIFGAFEFSLFYNGFYALSADESGHTLEAYSWIKNHHSIFSIWPPFHKIIVGSALKLYYDLFLTPRILSFIFGVLTLLSIYKLSNVLFGNKIISLITCFLAMFFAPISIFSILPLPEIYFFFFTITSLTFFIQWYNGGKEFYLWLSLLSALINSTIRYEAWIFSFVLFLTVVYKFVSLKKKNKNEIIKLLSIALLLSLFPLFWIYLSGTVTSNITGFITNVSQRYKPISFIDELKNNVFYSFILLNIGSLNIIGLVFLFRLYKSDLKIRLLLFIFFTTLICFSISTLIFKTMPTHNHWRIASIWSILLLPFTAYFIYSLLNIKYKFPIRMLLFIVSLSLPAYFFTRQTNGLSNLSYITNDDMKAGLYFQNLFKKEDSKIYIGYYISDKWKYSNILVASQKPENFITQLNNNKYLISDTLLVDQQLISEAERKKIQYFLLPTNLKITDTNYIYKKASFNTWTVYQLRPPK